MASIVLARFTLIPRLLLPTVSNILTRCLVPFWMKLVSRWLTPPTTLFAESLLKTSMPNISLTTVALPTPTPPSTRRLKSHGVQVREGFTSMAECFFLSTGVCAGESSEKSGTLRISCLWKEAIAKCRSPVRAQG